MRAAFPQAADAPAIVQPSQDPRFGDYQANGAMALAKKLKAKPRDVAAAVLERLDVSEICEPPEIAGPGFINLRLKPDWVAAQMGAINPDKPEDRLGVPRAERCETVVVDYSAPNLAKEMHVGHLRSTIIGDALVRMLDFAGHKVVRQNHVGDWGTQFGMLVAYMQRIGKERIDAHTELRDIEDLYRAAKRLYDEDLDFAETARQSVVRLQAGDSDALGWWKWLRSGTLNHCRMIYGRLGVLLKAKDIRGESYYNHLLRSIVEELGAKGLITESEGAQCVFLPGYVAKDEIGRAHV
jgi:arginyl-tRNA synthetase